MDSSIGWGIVEASRLVLTDFTKRCSPQDELLPESEGV
jgi:hypothetical protein